MRAFLILVLVLASTLPGAADTHRFITVQGEGRVDVKPDMATIEIAINHQERTAREAIDAVAANSNAVMAKLTELGISEGDIRTSGLSLNQVFDRRNNTNQPPKLVGFFASNRMSVKIRNLDEVGNIIDATIQSGVNAFQGISFDISDPKSALDQSRQAAVADALERADLYSKSAGVSLGDIVEISENSVAPAPGPMIRVESMRADSMPISPGTQAVTVNIWLKIELK